MEVQGNYKDLDPSGAAGAAHLDAAFPLPPLGP